MALQTLYSLDHVTVYRATGSDAHPWLTEPVFRIDLNSWPGRAGEGPWAYWRRELRDAVYVARSIERASLSPNATLSVGDSSPLSYMPRMKPRDRDGKKG